MANDKFHDEMYENRKGSETMMEAGSGVEDAKLTRRVLLKMDSRYVPLSLEYRTFRTVIN
jgi:hypothetical protein